MSSTILTNWTIYYSTDASAGAGYKQIKWNNPSNPPETHTNTVNELYSALMDLFSIDSQNDANDTIPMRAVTPSVYEIGSFDAGDLEPWFIDPESIKHLTDGSLNTVNWTRDLPGNGTGAIGIIMVQCSNSGFNLTSSDIGDTCTHDDSDSGIILHVDTTNYQVWIRPDDNTLANDFNSVTGNIEADTSSNTATTTTAGVSGERVWANIYSIGSIYNDTQLYVAQNHVTFTPWWNSGHFDRLFLTNDDYVSGLIDSGLLTVYAREYTKLYDYFQANVSSGGRNPIPLATSSDTNNTTGYRLLNGSSGVSDFDVGNYIYAPAAGGWSAATKKGIITAVSGTTADPDITYSPIGDLTAFTASDTVKEYDPDIEADGDGSCTADTIADAEIANLTTNPTFTFSADNTKDLNDGLGASPYNVVIDCKGNTLSDFYEYTKYITRRGYTTTVNGKEGQQYLGTGEIYLYLQSDGGFTEGDKITGGTSTATGYIVANHVYNPYYLTVRDVRGTFQDGETVTDETSGTATTSASGAVETITLSKTAPFGTFAGGNFFGTRGVWISNMHANDANNYQLVDSENIAHTPPASISIIVNGLESGDRVTVFRTTGDNEIIDKTYITSHTTENVTGNTTWEASASIPGDTPSAGYIRIVDDSLDTEERIEYTSYTGAIFTLASNHKGGYSSSDTAYVGYIDSESSDTNISQSITYDQDRYVLTRVRVYGIVPFKVKGQIISTGYTSTATRTTDPNVE